MEHMDCKDVIMSAGTIRELLCKHGFYTEMKLNQLVDIIKADPVFANGLSSYSISPDLRFIELRFRNAFVKKQDDMDFYQNHHLNEIICNWYKLYQHEISSIISDKANMIYHSDRSIMYYYISKYQNTVIVNFI